MKRIFSNVVLASMALSLWVAPVAQASTSPWTWTDISAQLTERNNRPVWATAYANGFWYYTDGQNLWNGGQVYRYDGTTQVTITTDVRNAGIDRVDDIVSDGQSVLFLQDVVRLDNQLKVVAYRNGQYLNITNNVRNVLQSDEGVRSVTGRNGTWMILTSKGRLFSWMDGSNNPTQLTLPTTAQNGIARARTMYTLMYTFTYRVTHSTFEGLDIAIVPVGSSAWLLAAPNPVSGIHFSNVILYRYENGTFTDVTNVLGIGTLKGIHSNGSTALLRSGNVSGANYDINGVAKWVHYDGNASSRVVSFTAYSQSSPMIGWNGKSWLVLDGKQLYRVTSSIEESLGRVNDSFLSIAADTNGRFLLGGAVSTSDRNDPTSPLTAKLVMVTEGVATPSTSGSGTVTTGGSFGGDRVYTSPTGPRLVVQGDPSNFRVGQGKEFAYRVTASDVDGVDRTDLYVNDARIKTCYSDVCEFRTTYWTNGAATRSVKFWVRSTDKRGYSTDTMLTPDYLTVDANSTATAGGTVSTNTDTTTNSTTVSDAGSGISTWTWLDPNTTTLATNQTVTFNVGAWDANGIKKIEIIVNGNVKRTCDFNNATGNQNCTYGIIANEYNQGTNVFVNAKITDADSKTTWTNGTTLYRGTNNTSTNTGATTNTTTNTTNVANGSVSAWSSPSGTFRSTDLITVSGSGSDPDGVNRTEIYVNAERVKTCSGSGTCSVTVGPFGSRAVVTYAVTIFDNLGHYTTTGYTSLYRSN